MGFNNNLCCDCWDDELWYMLCEYLVEYKCCNGVESFWGLQKCVCMEVMFGWVCIKWEDEEVLQCMSCVIVWGCLYVCLVCVNIGCWSGEIENNLVFYVWIYVEGNIGYVLVVDIECVEFFCCLCSD